MRDQAQRDTKLTRGRSWRRGTAVGIIGALNLVALAAVFAAPDRASKEGE